MSSTETPPRLSQACALGDGVVVAVASERDTDGRLRSSEHSPASGSTSSGDHSDLMCRVQERVRERDHEWPCDVYMADAVAFLISAHAILENLSSDSFRDPRAAGLIGSVCGKVFEALSTLDDFSVTQWIKSGSTAGIGCSFAPLPTWWRCLADQD
jgi:hypothetical protein